MAKVEIFWREGCGFCGRVMAMFESRGVGFIGKNIWQDENAKAEMAMRVPNSTSVPQVFIDGEYIGGCDDTMALHSSGALDEMLK